MNIEPCVHIELLESIANGVMHCLHILDAMLPCSNYQKTKSTEPYGARQVTGRYLHFKGDWIPTRCKKPGITIPKRSVE